MPAVFDPDQFTPWRENAAGTDIFYARAAETVLQRQPVSRRVNSSKAPTRIDWAIVGGESGPRARVMRPEWVEEIEAMCRSSGTAFFFKQWGGKNKKRTGRVLRGRTYDEMPTSRAIA
jgi:protein gp37